MSQWILYDVQFRASEIILFVKSNKFIIVAFIHVLPIKSTALLRERMHVSVYGIYYFPDLGDLLSLYQSIILY